MSQDLGYMEPPPGMVVIAVWVRSTEPAEGRWIRDGDGSLFVEVNRDNWDAIINHVKVGDVQMQFRHKGLN